MRKTEDYLEWDGENAEAARRRAVDKGGVERLYDCETRMRVGEMIARAMQSTDKRES